MISEKHTFDSGFEVFLADTLESKQIHFNLRYQVYCEEMGFEDKDKFPGQMEFDEWDDDAVHFLVRHKGSGHWLGGLRLVQNTVSLPFEKLSAPYQQITDNCRLSSVEISRLCIVKEARRFSAKRFAPYGLPNEDYADEGDKVKSIFNFKNQSQSLMWGLFRAAAVYSAQQELEHWYFIVAPSLASFIRKAGVDMNQVGEACDYRGLRIPYRLSVDNILANPLWRRDYKNDFRLYSDLAEELPKLRRACF